MKDRRRRRAALQAAKVELAAREQAAAAEQAAREQRYEQRVAARQAHKTAHGAYPKGRPPVEPPSPSDRPLRVNTTDPDSRTQRSARGFLQGFNAQAVVAQDQLIVAVEVVDQTNDAGQLAPMTAAALANLEQAGIAEPVEVVLADAGYFHSGQLTALSSAHRDHGGPEALVPPDRDALRDPERQQPPLRQSTITRGMRERLAEPEQRARYRRRQAIVEPVFGQIKNRITSRFRLRGLPAVRSELTLIATAHNLLKLHAATP